jgi:6-phosphofructokinase 1
MSLKPLKKIAVLTSGGDAPGMNAAIRAVVRASIFHKLEIMGVLNGYEGLIEGKFVKLLSNSVSNIIQRGGTILKSARSEEFRMIEGRKKAYANLLKYEVDALIVIGGDGTFMGAHTLYKEFEIPVIGIPGTIDNDLYGTDYTIGYDSAINTAVEAIDKIRDTADSHNRLFFIEVMGRDAGLIALRSGIAGGAEAILIPESITDIDAVIKKLELGWHHQKSSSIVIVAEGDQIGGAFEAARVVQEKFDHYDVRVSVLGHIQRGGNPTCMDRVIASRMGVASVEALLAGHTDIMVGIIHNDINYTPLENAVKYHIAINKNLTDLVDILAG